MALSAVNCACLVKFDRSHGAQIIRTVPPDDPILQNHDLISWCCFPEASNQLDSVHVSTLTNLFCFHWCFVYKDERYAVTLISHKFLAAPLVRLLQDARKTLSDSPDARLDAIWECACKWTLDGDNITVHTPAGRYTMPNSPELATFWHFDPTVYFGAHVNFVEVWDALMTNAGVLVVGDTPAQVSSAVLSLLSLIAPLRFCDPILAYTRFGDPRLRDIIEGSTHWKVVGTTNTLVLERCRQFKVVLRLKPERAPSSESIRNTMKTRTKRLLARLRIVMNDQLDHDPYWDLLGLDISEDRLALVHKAEPFLTIDELQTFIRTSTFKEWQTRIAAREEFRDSFLSAPPEEIVSGRSLETLEKMEAALAVVETKYSTDTHVMAVVARHRHFIRREKKKCV